ncbi:unnamed protein product [Ixodes pacificus]
MVTSALGTLGAITLFLHKTWFVNKPLGFFSSDLCGITLYESSKLLFRQGAHHFRVQEQPTGPGKKILQMHSLWIPWTHLSI